jgi:nucleotide-binding universal stress UspA family protein
MDSSASHNPGPDFDETGHTGPDTAGADSPVSNISDTIVVGHDGSAGSADALELAADLAERYSVPLLVVRAWSIDSAPSALMDTTGYVSSVVEIGETVRSELIEETLAVLTKHPLVSVEFRAVQAHPADALVRMSAGARMLVVGSRGRGGFARMLLGSVSEQCVNHAQCPVLVYRPSTAPAR